MTWLPLAEAAIRLGLNKKTLDCRGRRGTVKTKDGPTGRLYFVEGGSAVVLDSPGGSAIEDLARLAGGGRSPKGAVKAKPAERRRRDMRCAVIICDWHVPVHHEGFVGAVFDWIDDVQPDTVVINGDFVDLESASSHGGNASPPKLLEEMEAGNAILDRIDEVAPASARKIYNMGNHEDRLQRSITALIPALHGAIEIADLLQLEARGYEVNDYGVGVSLGRFEVVHGKASSRNHANFYLARHGTVPGGGIGYGHTHRPQVMTKNNRAGFGAAYGFGHGHDEAVAHYLKKAPSDWVMGFGVVFYDEDSGDWAAYPVLAPEGRFIWNGRAYG